MCIRDSPKRTSGNTCQEEIIGILNQAKVDFGDPFLLLGGDFNEFGIEDIIRVVPDLREAASPPTRSLCKIDLIATNFDSSIESQRKPWNPSVTLRRSAVTTTSCLSELVSQKSDLASG